MDEYIDMFQPLEENSILILQHNDSEELNYAFYQKDGKCQRIENTALTMQHFQIGYSGNNAEETIDIQYTKKGKTRYRMYWADIPDKTSVYIENHGIEPISLEYGDNNIVIRTKERIRVDVSDCLNYEEVINEQGILPNKLECFERKYVIEKIKQEKKRSNHTFTIIDKMDECRMKERAYMAKTAKGVILAIILKETCVKELIEAGAVFRLLDTVKVSFYDEKRMYLGMGEISFMEFMIFDWDMPDEMHTYLWSWAKKHCKLPAPNLFELRFVHDKDKDKKLLQQVVKLRMIWEEAAEVALSALIRYFEDRMVEIGEEFYKSFPDKLSELTIEIFETQILEKYPASKFYQTGMRSEQEAVLQEGARGLWQLYKCYGKGEGQKETVVYLIEKILLKINWETRLEWLIIMLLEGTDDFGEILLEKRIYCIQEFMKSEAVSNVVWNKLVRTGFLPTKGANYLIEKAKDKNPAIIPILMVAKYRNNS